MPTGSGTAGSNHLGGLGWALALALAALPFLFVAVPPLSDAPGHLGQAAIAAAGADSPLRHDFAFAWGLRLNLGTDLLVEALRHLLGLERAFWLVCALIPLLTVAAVAALARSIPGRAAAASFALPFAYAYPFSFGFLNYMLGVALALLGFALWRGLAHRPRLREALFWPILPVAMIVHAVGGGLALVWTLASKGSGIVQALRDQNRAFDIASMALVMAVPLLGWRLGARYARSSAAAIGAIALLFVVMPAEINGSAYNDLRLVPPLAILVLALQDWSAVPRRWRIGVAAAGLMLFALRIAVTTLAFAGYARSYAAEARALPHIARGARVLALVTRPCRASRAWRSDRLEHFPAMATVRRAAWTNALWDVPSIHLLAIRYRPSPLFYDDPSHYAWPADCVDRANAWERRTIAQAAPLLPLDRVDYLWVIRATLPPGPWLRRLTPAWTGGGSTLYRVIRRGGPAPH